MPKKTLVVAVNLIYGFNMEVFLLCSSLINHLNQCVNQPMKQECTGTSILNQMEPSEMISESLLAYHLSHSNNKQILQIPFLKCHFIKKWRICFF